MAELETILDDAAREGLIPVEAKATLLPFLLARGVTAPMPARPDEDALPAWSDTETPRFIRGFHDVLITIGVVVALCGLWGLASIFVVLPAIVLLSEILVRRQRLALPAVVLTIALVFWTGSFTSLWLAQKVNFLQGVGGGIRFVAVFPPVLGIYYLRYRVPLALALCIMSVLALVIELFCRAVLWSVGDPLLFVNHPGILSAVFLACALGLFAAALSFDLRDRDRRTTRSDTAFWLHMGAAPALLYSTMSIFLLQGNMLELTQAISAKTFVVVLTVAILMLIGLIIDRRAFVTSGLLSLGYALYGVFRMGSATMDTYVFTTLLVVGVIVLVIGTGWMSLRRRVIGVLPAGIVARLPPA